jgi:hypothetical protein
MLNATKHNLDREIDIVISLCPLKKHEETVFFFFFLTFLPIAFGLRTFTVSGGNFHQRACVCCIWKLP